jgi:hypothetical protein
MWVRWALMYTISLKLKLEAWSEHAELVNWKLAEVQYQCFPLIVHLHLDKKSPSIRAANESSRAELGWTQARLMKIRVESSRARETVRAEKPSSNSARYYSS